MDKVIVKVQCRKNDAVGPDSNMIEFWAPVDDVNVEWSKYTPYLDYKMSCVDSAAEHFKVGRNYMLTLEECE